MNIKISYEIVIGDQVIKINHSQAVELYNTLKESLGMKDKVVDMPNQYRNPLQPFLTNQPFRPGEITCSRVIDQT